MKVSSFRIIKQLFGWSLICIGLCITAYSLFPERTVVRIGATLIAIGLSIGLMGALREILLAKVDPDHDSPLLGLLRWLRVAKTPATGLPKLDADIPMPEFDRDAMAREAMERAAKGTIFDREAYERRILPGLTKAMEPPDRTIFTGVPVARTLPGLKKAMEPPEPQYPILVAQCQKGHEVRILVPRYEFNPFDSPCEKCGEPLISLKWGGMRTHQELFSSK